MNIKNVFAQGKMNTDVDERLVIKGQYPYAKNLRVTSTDSSDAGAVENPKGNEKLSNLNLTNAVTLNSFTDDSNELIYYFVTSDEKDLLLEYNRSTNTMAVVLESSNPGGVLNFDSNYLVTAAVKIYNGDPNRDLIIWTDNNNGIRCANIERAKTYGADGFVEDDISLIKKPPRYAPEVNLTYTDSTLENNLEDKFLRFAYRYKYLDGEFSALSSFSNVPFQPLPFDLDYSTLENNGMVNTFNAVDITFDTGSERVTDVQLVFRESGRNNVYVIETFNKEAEGWGDDEDRSFTFSNSKIPVVLPEDELNRLFDNVPLKAKALEMINNRLVLGNYVEGYNLIDVNGDDVNLDVDLELISTPLVGDEFFWTITVTTSANDTLVMDFTDVPLTEGTRLSFDFDIQQTTIDGDFTYLYEIILNRDYTDAIDLATSDEFILFMETIATNVFTANYTVTTPPADSTVNSITGYDIVSSTATSISVVAPVIEYEIDNGVDPISYESYGFTWTNQTALYYSEVGLSSSVKTNRSYEIALEYLDEYNRLTTALTDDSNTIYVPQLYSTSKNEIRIILNNLPSTHADRYKFLIKQNKEDYQTVYGAVFYQDGLYRWIKLEGASRDKVNEGDILIVKSDLSGVVDEVVKVRVLEITAQQPDFVEGNVDADGDEISEEGGLYMKVKPLGFDMDNAEDNYFAYSGVDRVRSGRPKVNLGSASSLVGYWDATAGQYVDYPINGGTRITMYFRNYESDGYNEVYENEFIVQDDYANMEDWWNAEVIDLGDEEVHFNWWFTRESPSNRLILTIEGQQSGAFFERSKLFAEIKIERVAGILIFETEPADANSDIFYETVQTFDIVNNLHQGNVQNQELDSLTSGTLTIGKIYKIVDFQAGDDFTNVGATTNATGEIFEATGTTPTTWSNSSELRVPAVIDLDFYNCYVQGNGAESYRYKDAQNLAYMSIETRANAADVERYREIRRFADLTYSERYESNTSINALNEFNLSRANFKDDLDKKYGAIQKLYARDTDLVVFQEDKISKVLYGKDLLLNADGTGNVSSIEDVLGQQIAYTGEYGISTQPESFAVDGNNLYFTDAKRGAVLRLGLDGITEISKYGMKTWFRTLFSQDIHANVFGSYDPFYDVYVIHTQGYTLTFDDDPQVKGWTSYWSYMPQNMVGLNGEFFSFSNGELYVHNSDEVPYGTFYGTQYPTEIHTMLNESPSDIKVFKSIKLEGNYAWDTLIRAYVSMKNDYVESTIDASEYDKREGHWYAYTRGNEDDAHINSLSTYGIGVVTNIAGTTVTINGYGRAITAGDELINNNDSTVAGNIVSSSRTGNVTTIVLDAIGTLTTGAYVYGRKPARIEGGAMRGYTARVELSITQDDKVELFAVNSKIFKSYT